MKLELKMFSLISPCASSDMVVPIIKLKKVVKKNAIYIKLHRTTQKYTKIDKVNKEQKRYIKMGF